VPRWPSKLAEKACVIGYVEEKRLLEVTDAYFTTLKSGSARDAVDKAKGNVRILRGSEFTTFMSKYIELMEKGWKIEDPAERLAFMERMPSLEKYEQVFKPSNDPLVSLDELLSVL
jgi:hypothetical protein